MKIHVLVSIRHMQASPHPPNLQILVKSMKIKENNKNTCAGINCHPPTFVFLVTVTHHSKYHVSWKPVHKKRRRRHRRGPQIYIYIYICILKSMALGLKQCITLYMHMYMYIYTYITHHHLYLYIYLCFCVYLYII